jgi:hypothetical protein
VNVSKMTFVWQTSVTKPHVVKHGSIHINDREFSDIKIFEHSRKGISLFMFIFCY